VGVGRPVRRFRDGDRQPAARHSRQPAGGLTCVRRRGLTMPPRGRIAPRRHRGPPGRTRRAVPPGSRPSARGDRFAPQIRVCHACWPTACDCGTRGPRARRQAGGRLCGLPRLPAGRTSLAISAPRPTRFAVGGGHAPAGRERPSARRARFVPRMHRSAAATPAGPRSAIGDTRGTCARQQVVDGPSVSGGGWRAANSQTNPGTPGFQ
jgi:hypothetical protein